MTAIQSSGGFGAYFRSLVHESVRDDALASARHQSFIASHLIGGLLALGVFPVYLAVTGKPTALSAAAFVWLLSPVLIALFLSKTGRLGTAHIISAVNLAGLVTFAAGLTGGITSFLVAWMIVVPLEAALSADRRVVLAAIGAAGAALLGLAAAGLMDVLPPARQFTHDPAVLALLGAMSALVYAGGLAISVQAFYNRSEQAVRLGERRYRLLAENSTDMITRHDAVGKVVFASVAARQIVGGPPSALTGNGLRDRIHVADRGAYLAALDQCMADGQAVSVEFRVDTRIARDAEQSQDDGAYKWVEMRCRPVLPGEGGAGSGDDAHAREIVAVTRDIAARKAQEDEILRARDMAEAANRAKTQFLANMSHELRTPLNAIIGFSEILDRELYGRIGEERYREYAHLIHESGEHLLSVVNEILDMSKIEAGRYDIVTEPFEVAGLVTSCCEIMRHQAESKSIDLRIDVAAGLPELVADKRACKQVLLNLLANAVKFTGEGGYVQVSAARGKGGIEFAVSDNGIGISEEDLPRLGNPFVQADASYNRNYEGAGLGLSVVKGLVRLHDGTLKIDSTVSEGTTVSIRLPVDASAGAGAGQEAETAQEPVPLAAASA